VKQGIEKGRRGWFKFKPALSGGRLIDFFAGQVPQQGKRFLNKTHLSSSHPKPQRVQPDNNTDLHQPKVLVKRDSKWRRPQLKSGLS